MYTATLSGFIDSLSPFISFEIVDSFVFFYMVISTQTRSLPGYNGLRVCGPFFHTLRLPN